MNDDKPDGADTYALGEAQVPGEPLTRHAVANGRPGAWGLAVCGYGLVWVHDMAGDVIPFDLLGAVPLDLLSEQTCSDCMSVVQAAQPSPQPALRRAKRRWLPHHYR